MFNNVKVNFFLADKNAKMPTQGSSASAGYDLYASNETPIIIGPGDRVLIPTGLVTQFPEYVYGRIADRSGIAYKMGGHVLAGVIDSDYRGTIGVVLHNTNNINKDFRDIPADEDYHYTLSVIREAYKSKSITVNPGDRIAQLIFEMKCNANFVQVNSKEELDSSSRDAGGFGSTGMK
jgi:dUTP pyrophosphatase